MLELETQVSPQSCAKSPTPRIPVNPALTALVSACRQALVRVPKLESMTWIGTWTAGSPPRVTLASCTGPQSEEPSAYSTHSAKAPEPAVTWVRATLPRACLKMRSP